MPRARWVALVLLAAAGCIAGDRGRFGSAEPEPFGGDLEREIHEGLARAEETAGGGSGERTGNVTLVVEKILVDRRDTSNIEAAWRYADEHVVAGGGELARGNGIRIGVATDRFRAALQVALQKSGRHQVQKIMVTALSGTAGTISVGRDTYVAVLRYRTPLGETVLLGRDIVGASLVAVPTVLPGDKVHVRLHPRFTTSDGRVLDLAEMSTEVVLRHGQPMVIGGLDQSSDDAGSALFSWGREREERKVVLTVTPYIQGLP